MYLLDSNVLINFLNGSEKEVEWIGKHKLTGAFLLISVISKIETLSFSSLSEEQISKVDRFLDLFSLARIDDEVISVAASLRRKFKLPLADSIITASAITRRATLVTNDKILVKKIKDLVKVISI